MAYHARMVVDERLHLPSLVIENFRGIESLTLPDLGHVTLLTGKNGVGKSTVLEAVRAYATRGHPAILHELLTERREFTIVTDESRGYLRIPDWSALFHGRTMEDERQITVSPKYPVKKSDILTISAASIPSTIEARKLSPYRMTRHSFTGDEKRQEIKCESLGPSALDDGNMSFLWDKALEDRVENSAVHALDLVVIDTVSDIVMTVGEPRTRGNRRVLVGLNDAGPRVPLRSLGEGAVRILGIALALANSRGGFLLIDEAENGIHHSVQRDYWRMVLQAAHDNNVQVIATTHSGDCVRAFAQEAVDNDTVDGVLFRLEKDDDGIYPIEYSEEDLKVCAEQGIEVR